jgi:uncharacterized SAM-binding protein YcdF (DUF218 family)
MNRRLCTSIKLQNSLNYKLHEPHKISQYLDLHTSPVSADFAFVFGTSLSDPTLVAINLYQQRFTSYILLTGGQNRHTGMIESHSHRKKLIMANIPEQHILMEDTSTNTLDNVRNTLPIIIQNFDIQKLRRILIIVKWYHSRRALMTLKRHLPDGIRYYPITYEPENIRRKDWHLYEGNRQQILEEWEKIPKYLAQDHLAKVYKDGNAYV